MIKNYFLVAYNNFRKQKLFSLLNILGLTIGIACCMLLFLFIRNEFSYDNFHKNGKDIYRIMRVGDINGSRVEIPYVSAAYGPALLNDFPDAISHAVRVLNDNGLITSNHISFNEKHICLADTDFFNVFSFKLVKGNPAAVLNDPNSIVLTETSARKYFGSDNPIGKVLLLDKKHHLKVTGIAEDVPVNSHLQFDMVIPIEILRAGRPEFFTNFGNNTLFTYIQLKPGTDPVQLDKRFTGFMDKYLGKVFAESGLKMGLTAKPLGKVYFATDFFDNVKHGNKKMVYIFMSVALLILLIACINFVNLTTARASERSKEVGLRKVLGAVKNQLVTQFIFESALFVTIACFLSIVLVQLLMPSFNDFLGYTLPSFWNDSWFYVFIAGVIVLVGLLAGSYPAFMLSAFSPVESLKGKLKTGKGGTFFREALVVFQFGISVILIISVVVITSQMNYVRNSDLGFSKNQSVMVRFDNADVGRNKKQFKDELLAVSSVEDVSLMSGEPGGFHDKYPFETEADPTRKFLFNTEFTDVDFVKTLGLRIVAGRDLSDQFGTDTSQAVLINQTAASQLGYTPEQAIGKWMINTAEATERRTIVGVVKDYHFASLKEPIGPLVISPGDDNRLALIKIRNGDIPSTVSAIRKVYADVAPGYPFEYVFLDEQFDHLYRSEIRQEHILNLFSLIAIFVACLGLFGLASYTASRRTKEVGVRKVLGSSIGNIILLLTGDMLKPVLLGAIIAVPVGYFAMNKWLEGFAYRIHLHWWMFAVAMLTALLIAMFTVGTQAIKASMANPVNSLRSE